MKYIGYNILPTQISTILHSPSFLFLDSSSHPATSPIFFFQTLVACKLDASSNGT
jgi:hypothetical protein